MRTWTRVADLAIRIDELRLDGLVRDVSARFTRHTTVVALAGAGHTGVGEDVNYDAGDQQAFVDGGVAALPLTGRWTLASLAARLDRLELFPSKRPAHPSYRDYRRWAIESAAVDLALRQAGRSLADVLGREPRPVTFVVSRGLGSPPDASRVTDWLEIDPRLRFKLDATPDWDEALVARLAETGAVTTIDLKGAYHGTPVDQPANPALYARVVAAFPQAWIEDPAIEASTRGLLEPHIDRVTWDAPIHSVADIEALEVEPRSINVKPSRFGSVERLFDAYDHCARRGIAMYGGGQFELGPGRRQIQLLAALFHPDTPNDVAPSAYNDDPPRAGLPASPLDPRPASVGFDRAGEPA